MRQQQNQLKSKSVRFSNTSGDDSEDEISSYAGNIKIVPGNKMYSRATAAGVDSRNNVTPQYEDMKASELYGTSLPGRVFGSLKYSSNNPICGEISPDETGRTAPIWRGGDRIHIFSSSICRDMSEILLNDKLKYGSAQIHLHRGRKSNEIRKHVKEHLRNEKTDSMVIVGVGNDLSTSRSPETIASTLINIGRDCVEARVPCENVFISCVLPRADSQLISKRKAVNDLLRGRCEDNGFTFIENEDIILSRHIRSDGVHLNKSGTSRLLENIVDAINNAYEEELSDGGRG